MGTKIENWFKKSGVKLQCLTEYKANPREMNFVSSQIGRFEDRNSNVT